LKPKIITIITSAIGYRVVIEKTAMDHAMKHFILPEDIFLELLERILRDPTEVYVEDQSSEKTYHLFYRLEKNRYLLAVIKLTEQGAFFASAYSTGHKPRNKHRKLKRIKL
jgi:hypothetical protein